MAETDVQPPAHVSLVEHKRPFQLHRQECHAVEMLRDEIRPTPIAAEANGDEAVVGQHG